MAAMGQSSAFVDRRSIGRSVTDCRPSRPRPGTYRIWMAAVSIIAWGVGRAAAGDVEAVAPNALGVLTKCRGWVIATSCNTYHHISLPPRIAVGDTITVYFGSSPKDYAFPVARIDLNGRHCVIFSEAAGDRHQMDKI